ncbi:MAG: AraC family transcriptional regulator, partial [Anaerolineaceae bacterium]
MPIYFNLSSHNLPLTIDSIGNRWIQERIRRPKGYPLYHWLQTENGAGEIIIGENQLILPEKTGILIKPFTPHSYHAKQKEWITSFVTFTGKLESDISKIIGNERFILVAESNTFSFQSWTDSIILEYEAGHTDPVQLSVKCYEFLMNINHLQNYRDYSNQPQYQNYVLPVTKEIETNYHTDIKVQDLADMVYISPQYLNRLFNHYLGCKVYQYLKNYRLSKAKELLANNTDLTISHVSFLVGYNDTSHFIATFKSAVGYT